MSVIRKRLTNAPTGALVRGHLDNRVRSWTPGFHSCRSQHLPFINSHCRIVHRTNSWSRMKITLDMFKALCLDLDVDPSFAACIVGMGRRLKPSDEHFINSYSQVYHHPPTSPTCKFPPVKSFSEYLTDSRTLLGWTAHHLCSSYASVTTSAISRDMDESWQTPGLADSLPYIRGAMCQGIRRVLLSCNRRRGWKTCSSR